MKTFSRVDLLFLVASITLLGLTQWPRMANPQNRAGLVACLANMNALGRAWTMYADDHQGALAPNAHGGAASSPNSTYRNWCRGWLDWTTASDNVNTARLVDPAQAALGRYVEGQAAVFRCPDDRYLSAAQRSMGWTARVRTYSMNSSMGEGNDKLWYPGRQTIFVNRSEFQRLSPRDAFVFTEEHADSINDGAFFVNLGDPSYLDLPAVLHGNATVFAFADGHAEPHGWREPTFVLRPVKFSIPLNAPVSAASLDLAWLRAHTTIAPAP